MERGQRVKAVVSGRSTALGKKEHTPLSTYSPVSLGGLNKWEINNLEIYESKIVVLIWGKTIHYRPHPLPLLHTSNYLLPTKSKVTTHEEADIQRDAIQDNGFKGLRETELFSLLTLRLSSPPRRGVSM